MNCFQIVTKYIVFILHITYDYSINVQVVLNRQNYLMEHCVL